MISALSSPTSALSALCRPKLSFLYQRSTGPKLTVRPIPRALRVGDNSRNHVCIKCNASGNSHQGFRLNDVEEFHPEPFWLSFSREALGALRSLLVFLVEQPSQLRYIEWPSFQSTLKTATLTLVLMALLIIALSSIDSVLCYLLSFLLRRAA